MSNSAGAGVRLEIGHVLFMDVVGYSKLLLDEQRELVEHLTEIVRNTEQVRAAEAADKLIRLPAGDGMALVFFNSPEAPVQCAIEITKKLKQHPQLKLRMGIHSGPVNEVQDVNGRANVAGAGINIAQRVMDCGDTGHILLSKRVAEDLTQSRQWRPYLHDLGECAVKHSVPISIVNLYTDEIGNAQLPQKVKQWQSEQAAQAADGSPSIFRRKGLLIAAGALLIAVATFCVWLYFKQAEGTSLVPEKTIAVLPFQNFSPDKENAFFADGVQDDILTSLAKIKDLRVISRSSVMKFRDAAAQNLRAIGKTLGVANVLEGSVRREGDRVVVNVQLVDAKSARQIWANHYDRTLADSLGLQGELASEIAEALRATLSTDEQARVTAKPTQNPDAYVFYLRANQISRNPDTLLEDYKTAEQLYVQAIALDPDFALAHARLASVCAEIFHYYEPTQDWENRARAEAEIALHLQPNLAEAHLALGQCIYWMDQDYERALEQFDIAARLSPSNGDIGRLIAAIKRRQGKWEQSLKEYERVARLDPQNPNTVRELIFTNTAMRRWPEAARWVEQLRAMAPASIVAKIQSGYVDFWWKGDTALLKSFLNQVPSGVDPDGGVTSVRWEVAMLDRDYAAARRAIDGSTAKELSYTAEGATPRSFFEGSIALAQGDIAGSQKYFADAQPVFENAVKEAPLSAMRHANLGWFYAFMGRKEDAMREGRRAVELKPESKDAVDGVIANCYLALIYARVGEKDLAFALLDRLIKTPGAVDSVDYSVTINDLKHRWEWDPIRSDPRFQKLLEQPAK
ncbi:MAG TPA: tetratricopeptide repeat protein [Candidatus Udaeobacter sp.]|nr:tetratricopeptide repeat protein [Candidatus Udaeobacter sp.]